MKISIVYNGGGGCPTSGNGHIKFIDSHLSCTVFVALKHFLASTQFKHIKVRIQPMH